MNKTITTFVFALAFVAMATLTPVAQAHESSDPTHTHSTSTTATSTATTTTPVATTTATTTPATNSTIAGLLAQIAKLTELFNELKAKLAGTQAEIKELRSDLREGMTDADVRTIQELLASDPSIYPKGLVTGYFGPMTKEAIMRFQSKNGLDVTGEIDTETRAAMDAIIAERRAQGKFPIGLLMAPGLKMKFEDKLKKRCEYVLTATTTGPVVGCDKIKAKYKFEMDDKGRMKMEMEMKMKMEDDEDDEDDDSSDVPTMRDAMRQIADAEKALTAVQRKLDKKEYVTGLSSSTLTDIKGDVVDAKEDIKDAKTALAAMDYVKASMLAEQAEEMLDDAKDMLEGEDEDDEDDDEGEDEDEDEDEDDEDDN